MVKRVVVGLVLFVLVSSGYAKSEVMTSYDSYWTSHLAMSLVRSGDLDLDEYVPENLQSYRLFVNNGHIRSFFPVGTVFLSAPFYKLTDWYWLQQGFDGYEYFKAHGPDTMSASLEKGIAVVLTSLAVLIFYAAASLLDDNRMAALLGLVFAFSTPAWSITSRALWSHTGSLVLFSMVLWLLVRADAEKKHSLFLWMASAVSITLSYIVRPTNSIVIAAFFVYAALKLRGKAAWLLVAGLFAGLVALVLQDFAFGTPYPPYFVSSRIGLASFGIESFSGVLFSPQRGLFIYCSWVLVPIAFFVSRLFKRELSFAEMLLMVIVVLQVFTVAAFAHWWGGHSFGPRLLTESVFALLVLSLLQIKSLRNKQRRKTRSAYVLSLAVLGLLSAFIHFKGATSRDVWAWNASPENVDGHTERLWDWRDVQFLR